MPRWSTSLIVLADSHETAGARRDLLEQAGHAVTIAETAARAVELARHWMPGLIIVHDPLPDASAAELCGRLASDSAGREMPVLITGGSAPATGDSFWLPEPVDAPVLLAMAAALVRGRGGGDDLRGERERRMAVLERFLAEAALEQSERKFRRFLEANIIGVVCAGPAGVFEANGIFLDMLGYTPADLPLAWPKLLAPASRDCAKGLAEEVVRRGFVKPFEAEFIHRDGNSVPVLAGSALYSAAPEWVCFVLDLTGRKRVERALAESEAHFRLALEGSPVVVFSQDLELRYTWVYNPRGLEGPTGRTDAEIFPHGEAAALEEFKRRVMQAGTRSHQEFALTIRGEQRCYDIWAEPISDAAGRLAGITGAAVDITERKTIEARLRESSKLETIGRLGAGIAHDFNNVLATVIGGASYALGLVPEGHAAHRVIQMVLEGGQRAARITSQLAAYAGEGRFEIESVDLSRLVLELQPMLRSSVAGFIELRLALADDLPPVKADPQRLQDVVVNLLLNAAEAIPAGSPGVIDIRTGVRCAAGECRVLLEVSDTGCGMDEETQRRIFDPFFSTKFVGRGLGLAAVAGIVRSHDGSIEVRSAPGAGSRFTVLLPAAGAEGDTAGRAAKES